ncbi:hypothetical protein [Nocardiopsis sp. NRRL B-16309]|uniref:hypothetical protein n=1 Tax=Nocardiopsis sp. NRRL B-16309 TaxID=1519494 RepID=UPI0006AE7909|nr:hypothetical protein [Nocardiopsis sp. NRRL B-16309]KOX15260.1 hypothetical protein ADL05_15830 [Nocardiopsis sp. NRRL B-16309]
MATATARTILRIMKAAEQIGLDPVAETTSDGSPWAVDLRVVDGDTVAAAIRVYPYLDTWRYEVPARVGTAQRQGLSSRHLVSLPYRINRTALRQLDHYFASVTDLRPSAPKPPRVREDVLPWMRVGYWEERLARRREASAHLEGTQAPAVQFAATPRPRTG